MNEDIRGKRVFVGLSGGVDSSVTAALLLKAGADVTGVFIKGWYPEGMPCTWASDRRDAMRVAAKLHIPFVTLDASREYKEGVIDYLLAEYAKGNTPNPDIMCNREVKFGVFYKYARAQGADFIATGHYARTKDGSLLKGVDPEKDQSYFLWAVPKDALAHTLFPLGDMHKSDVRALAKKFDLPVAEKRDSQGICFLGSISVEDFLKQELGSSRGQALALDGSVLGIHEGVTLYTLGARAALHEAPPGPWYVVRKDMQANTITVSKDRRPEEKSGPIVLTQTNWLEPVAPGAVSAQSRYHGPIVEGMFDPVSNTFTPTEASTEPYTSGQSLVLYTGDVCIGGGIMR